MKLYLVLMSTSSMLSRAIKMYTRAPYNHSSIALNRNLSSTYSFGRRKIWNPLLGGFVREEMTHNFFMKSQCAVYECELTKEQYEIINDKIKYFKDNRRDYRYNFMGLFAIALKYEYKRPRAYFCSQFVGELLEDSGVCSLPKSKYLITPEDLSEIDCFTKVYHGTVEGYLSEYGIIDLENKAGATI